MFGNTGFGGLLKETTHGTEVRMQGNKPYFRKFEGLLQRSQRGKEVWAKINTAQSLSFAIEPYLKVVAEAGFEPTTFGL